MAGKRIHTRRGIVVLLAVLGVAGLGVGGVFAASSADWPSYLHDSTHSSSTSAAPNITPSSAQTLRNTWTFVGDSPTQGNQPPNKFYSSPTVYEGTVYIGANTGWFYAIDLATGHVEWKVMLGYQPKLTCAAHGFVSTAAVAPDPNTGSPTVYVGAPDGYLYALNAANGATRWRSQVGDRLPSKTINDIFNWASPVVANGRVYMGVSSSCDQPWVRGGLQSFNQASGALLATYWGVPQGAIGSGVWTSPALDQATGDVYVTTASGPDLPAPQGDDYSIVRLDGTTLAKEGLWTVPPADRPGDPDFASSPTLFHATINGTDRPLVAGCNKNGVLYAWDRNDLGAGPVWQQKVGLGTPDGARACLAAPIYDGSNLFEASNPTTIGEVPYLGSLRRLSPTTGAAAWETGLGGIILGSPSQSGGGVLAAPEYSTNPGSTMGLPLVDSANGGIVNFISGISGFSQPVFVEDGMLVASANGRLRFYQPATSGDVVPPAPPSMTATRSADSTRATLTWTPVSGVSSYRVFRNGELIRTFPGTTGTFTDTGLATTRGYSYFLQALDAAGNTSRQSTLQELPAPPGPLFNDGFESGSFSQWATHKNMTVQSSVKHAGTWAAKAVDKSTARALLPTSVNDAYARIWFNVVSHGSLPTDLVILEDEAGKHLARIRLAPDNRIQLSVMVGTMSTRSSTMKATLGTWHSLELHLTINGAQGQAEAWLDGTLVPGVSVTANFGPNPVGELLLGNSPTGRTMTSYFDDVRVDTARIGP
jgi:outer membrane protein assembly factor BamB